LTLIDFILNIVGLLLWLNWRAAAAPVRARPGTSLVATLRPAGPPRPDYYYWAGLPVLLVARDLFYWQAGGPVHWSPGLSLGPTTLVFRSDLASRMLLFSILSFALTLGVFYLWLLFLSWVNEEVSDANPVQHLIRTWLGRLERWPETVKLLSPLAVAVLAWCLLNLWLARIHMVPPNSLGRLLAQGMVLGMNGYLTLEYLVIALLVLYLINSYVYLGEFALWSFIDTTARGLLRPLRIIPLRVGKIDLTPVVAIILVAVFAGMAQRGLNHLYQKLV
jgi:uncharacterized protein YggT (Ycf19 family)